jgi:TRAP-type mannitol/chloroaromatic compound transport system substrate-binding protein
MSAYQCYCTWRKHCSAIEKLQGLKMSVLGTSSGVVLRFSGFPWSMCKEAKADSYNKLCPHMHAYI